MAQIINIATKQSGNTLTAGELNTIIETTNAAITEQNETKTAHAEAIGNKVDKVQGKGLSTNDYTTEEKQKLARLNEFNKGFFANEVAIIAAYPAGQAGWFVINGETDTVWLWDVEGAVWKNTGNSSSSVAGIINILYADLVTAIGTSALVPGASYMITDRGDRGLLFQAVAANRLAYDGVRFMLCPAMYFPYFDYNGDMYNGHYWNGIWDRTKHANIDNLTIWNGLVWKCIAEVFASGQNEPDNPPDQDVLHWVLVPKNSFENGEYVEMIFGCSYNAEYDWISKQWDDKGNVFGIDAETESLFDYGFNLCDYSDWNCAVNSINFSGNKCQGIYNNSNLYNIRNNSNAGRIFNNCIGGDISDNSNNGDISNNSNNGGIVSNSNIGIIFGNSNAGGISENSNVGDINSNANDGDISYNANDGGIYENSNMGTIFKNHNSADIFSNGNVGNVCNNSNDGEISGNSNVGIISNNTNGGNISANSSSPATTSNIQFNRNNGLITGLWDADVTDVIVDKTGNAL